MVVSWVWISPYAVHYPALDIARAEVYQAKAASYWCVMALVLLTVRSRTRLKCLLIATLVSATLASLAAILRLSLNTEFTLLGAPFAVLHRASGTFPNPDHFANYMAMSMGLGIGLLLGTAKDHQRPQRGWQGALLRLLDFIMSGRMLARLALVIIVIGLVLSRSRMGNASFAIGLLVLLACVAYAWPGKRRGALWLGASLLVVDLVIIGQWVGLEHVVQRLEGTELRAEADDELDASPRRREESVEERLSIGADALNLVRQAPLVGHGPASFYAVFPPVKSPNQIPYFFDHAHNDYAELAADLGVPALLGLGGIVALSLFRWARLMRYSTSTWAKGVACGSVMAVLCMLMHALVDFNLHIHANALLFTMALSLPMTLANTGRRRQA